MKIDQIQYYPHGQLNLLLQVLMILLKMDFNPEISGIKTTKGKCPKDSVIRKMIY
jgi:hypothetical protein